jgi:hypothetical protein
MSKVRVIFRCDFKAKRSFVLEGVRDSAQTVFKRIVGTKFELSDADTWPWITFFDIYAAPLHEDLFWIRVITFFDFFLITRRPSGVMKREFQCAGGSCL